MNQITQALVKAGVKTPSQSELLWRVVRDNPGKNAKALIALSALPGTSASTLLTQMVKRKMMRQELVPMKAKMGLGYGTRNIAHYYTAIPEFEVLPKPTKSYVTPPAPAVKPAVNIPRSETYPVVATPATTAVGFNLESLTIAQAREIHAQLGRMFK